MLRFIAATLNIEALKVRYVRTDQLSNSDSEQTVAAISQFVLLAQLAVQLAVQTGSWASWLAC